jgi:hypothetical protein
MADPVIRPSNGLLLIAQQAAEGTPTTLDPTLHAVPIVENSFTYGSPFKTEDTNESTGIFVGSAPLVIGAEVALSFRSRLKGAGGGITYTSVIKPPLHAPFQACGWRGQFTAAIAAAALTAGSGTTGTLGTGFAATLQAYMGMPLILSVGPGAGHVPFVTDYQASKVATLSDNFSPVLTTSTLAALPANWSYAGTTPIDAASRLTDHPCCTVGWYEDGNLLQWQDVRGILDLEGQSTRPGEAVFSMTGTYIGTSVVTMPVNQVVASHTPPLLVKGTGTPPAVIVNRLAMPISRWSLKNGGDLESVDDPNTTYGFGPGQISDRTPIFEADPLKTLVSTRDVFAEIAAFSNYPIVLRAGTVLGNRWGLLLPKSQPVGADPAMRGKLRSETTRWQALDSGRDLQVRNSDRFLTFY